MTGGPLPQQAEPTSVHDPLAEWAPGPDQGFLVAVLNNLSDALVACDAQGRLTLFNPAARQLHGLPALPLPTEQWSEYYDLYLADGVTPIPAGQVPLLRALRGEPVRDVAMVVAPAGQEPRLLHASGQQIMGRDGQLAGAVVVMHDVTARKAAESAHAERVREQEQRQAAELSLRRLQALNAAALAINSQHTVDAVLTAITHQAASVIGAEQAGFGSDAPGLPSTRGRLAAPLVRRDGSSLGLLQVSDKSGLDRFGRPLEFDETDQEALVQLAQVASLALEKAVAFEREHEVAVELQRSLLPQLPVVPGLALRAAYVPGRDEADLAVAGDLYDAFVLDEEHVALALGDVMGHGLMSASLMGQIRSALRALALLQRDPVIVVTALDRLVATLGEDAMATLAYGVLHLPTGRLQLVLAGHPAPLLRTAGTPSSGPCVQQLCADPGLPLGALPGTGYSVTEWIVPPGATLLLFSDGLVEGRGRSIDVGVSRLVEAFAGGPDPLAALSDDLLTQLTAGQNDDDVAMLLVRRDVGPTT